MKQTTIQRMSTEKLLVKLDVYDNKYREAIMHKRPCESWGYGMRAYHGHKTMSFAKQDAAKDNCNMIKNELQKRGVQAMTIYA